MTRDEFMQRKREGSMPIMPRWGEAYIPEKGAYRRAARIIRAWRRDKSKRAAND